MSNTISSSQLMMQQMQQMQLQSKSHPSLETNPLKINPLNLNTRDEQVQALVPDQVSFSDLLKGAVDHVNGMQKEAGRLKTDFTMGKEGVDLVDVMIASEKSSVAFMALMETSKKMMRAYNEIKRFRV